ncbi:uncharacterized protein LOC129808563 [Phlebotomus papatasi]|uniref:uncharacterized protein LOC129808563 n=1 Tax=Phlebotomus papatasi TaxID=29031 RepID=UPI0024835678|nr:uncharacterized protein LOC129808563 [Phlebotomus papatasi]
MSSDQYNIVCYADDAVLMAENEDDLQRLLQKFNISALKYNMSISTSKTKALTVSKEPIRCKLYLNNAPIEQVMEFKYLGVETTSHRDLHAEVRHQAARAAAISGCLRDVVWKNKYMNIKNKIRIYKTCVRPIMTYAAETRADNTRTKRTLRTTEMKTLRTICGYSLRDKKRSSDIREECEVQDIVRWSRSRRRYWRDHVNRMDDTRLAKRVQKNLPASNTRPRGRPPKRWYESWTSESQLRLMLSTMTPSNTQSR